jgi:hypothetical protein
MIPRGCAPVAERVHDLRRGATRRPGHRAQGHVRAPDTSSDADRLIVPKKTEETASMADETTIIAVTRDVGDEFAR